jgi:hypothetical protein
MNGSQLQALLEKHRNDPDMKPFPRLAAIRSAIMSLSDTDPAAAMAVLTEMAGQLGDSSTTFEHVIGKWASTDPLAALAWMRGNAATGKVIDVRDVPSPYRHDVANLRNRRKSLGI